MRTEQRCCATKEIRDWTLRRRYISHGAGTLETTDNHSLKQILCTPCRFVLILLSQRHEGTKLFIECPIDRTCDSMFDEFFAKIQKETEFESGEFQISVYQQQSLYFVSFALFVVIFHAVMLEGESFNCLSLGTYAVIKSFVR